MSDDVADKTVWKGDPDKLSSAFYDVMAALLLSLENKENNTGHSKTPQGAFPFCVQSLLARKGVSHGKNRVFGYIGLRPLLDHPGPNDRQK